MQRRYRVLEPPVPIVVRKGSTAKRYVVTIPMMGPFDWIRFNDHCVITGGARSPLPAIALPLWSGAEDREEVRVSVGGRDVPW